MKKHIFEFIVEDINYSVKLSKHARQRMAQRRVTKANIIENIQSISTEDLNTLKENKQKAIIINKETKVNIVLGFNESNIVTVITVIKKANPYASKGTVKVNL